MQRGGLAAVEPGALPGRQAGAHVRRDAQDVHGGQRQAGVMRGGVRGVTGMGTGGEAGARVAGAGSKGARGRRGRRALTRVGSRLYMDIVRCAEDD